MSNAAKIYFKSTEHFTPVDVGRIDTNTLKFIDFFDKNEQVSYNVLMDLRDKFRVRHEEYLNEKDTIKKLFSKLSRLDQEDLIADLSAISPNKESSAEKARMVPQWADRTTGREISPVDWIRMHYGERGEDGSWKAEGLTRAHLQDDAKLYGAYATWIRRHPEDDLHLPRGERRDALPAKEAAERRRASSRASYHKQKVLNK